MEGTEVCRIVSGADAAMDVGETPKTGRHQMKIVEMSRRAAFQLIGTIIIEHLHFTHRRILRAKRSSDMAAPAAGEMLHLVQ